MQRFNVSGCQKKVSETNGYVTIAIERLTYLTTLTSVHRIPERNYIMAVMQKLIFLQELTVVIKVEYLHSSLKAYLIRNCSIQRILQVQLNRKKVHMMHILTVLYWCISYVWFLKIHEMADCCTE